MMEVYRDISRGLAVVILLPLHFIADNVQGATNADEEGLCFRAKSLGHREGNLYYCPDPDLPLCCERDNTHTCCRTEVLRNVNDQAILWGFLGLTIVSFALVYYYFTREGDYWESENVRLAAYHMAGRFGLTWFKRKKASDESLITRRLDTISERAVSATSSTSSSKSAAARGVEHVGVMNATFSPTETVQNQYPV